MSKILDRITIGLLLSLVFAGIMIMKNTAESNAVTTDVALIQVKNKSKVLQEIGLLTAELRILQREIDVIRDILEKEKNEHRRNR
jgi:uncharacterized protein YfeS